jgi:hypothetical protein
MASEDGEKSDTRLIVYNMFGKPTSLSKNLVDISCLEVRRMGSLLHRFYLAWERG